MKPTTKTDRVARSAARRSLTRLWVVPVLTAAMAAALALDVLPVGAGQTARPQRVALLDDAALPGTCLGAIDASLRVMARSGDLRWDRLREPVERLVKRAADCPEAGVEVIGSPDLVDMDLAELDLRWNGQTGALQLRAVGPQPKAPALIDGPMVRMVLR